MRPSLVLLMVLGKALIMWEGISATQVTNCTSASIASNLLI
jgi:hypothetical protein